MIVQLSHCTPTTPIMKLLYDCVVDSYKPSSAKCVHEDDMDGCSTFHSTCGTNLLKEEVNEHKWLSEESTSTCLSSIAEDHACFMGDDDDFVVDQLNKKDTTMVIMLMGVIEKQHELLIKKNEEIKGLSDEHKKLNGSHSSLIMKYEKLENEFSCATNSVACVAFLEKENQELKSEFEEITSKYMDLQEMHHELCRFS